MEKDLYVETMRFIGQIDVAFAAFRNGDYVVARRLATDAKSEFAKASGKPAPGSSVGLTLGDAKLFSRAIGRMDAILASG